MDVYPELSLLLSRRSAGGFNVDVTIFQPGSEAEIGLPPGEEFLVWFDLEELSNLIYLPEEYGKHLASSLFASLAVRRVFEQALDIAATLDLPLRVRLQVAANAPELHNIRWETLYDIQGEAPLFSGENILFSRYLSSPDMRIVRLRPKATLRALVAVANPSDLPFYGLVAVDVDSEIRRVHKSLGEIEYDILAGSQTGTPVTLDAIISRLRKGKYDILYLVSHGTYVNEQSWLFLENERGEVQRVSGDALTAQLENLRELPVLVALLACEGAGDGANPAIAALGPRLAEAGVPAVLAMQGKITMKTAEYFMPIFFYELADEGRVDRAASLARNAVRNRPDFWMPVLYTRLNSGVIYAKPGDLAMRPRELRTLNLRLIWLAVAVIALVLVTSGVGYLLLRPEPKPTEMTKGFNVAVARFLDINESGEQINKDEGEKIADYIARRLDNELAALDLEDYEVWGPELTGSVIGEDLEERAEVAGRIADDINAQVLIYGVVKHADNNSSFQPEFMVSSSGFRSQASEITGQNQLGKPLFIHLPFQRQGLEAENPAFIARSEALNLITIGLVYFANDNYIQAMEYFQQAIDLPNWLDDAGMEVAYLLMGNARTRQASRLLDRSQIPQAIADYDTALEIRERYYANIYGRAVVGKASAVYMLAFFDPQIPPTSETLDRIRLDEAKMLFQQALALEGQPQSSKLPQKIALGLGQIYHLEALLGEKNGLEKARQQYQSVVQAYQDTQKAEVDSMGSTTADEPVLGDPTLRELASFAFARLALIEVEQENYDQALDLYNRSINIASPYWEARYTTDLALIYAQRALELSQAGQQKAAQKEMQQAILQVRKGRDLASNLPDRALIEEAEDLLDSIQLISDQIEGGS